MSAFLPALEMPHAAAALRDAHSASVEARWVAAMALGSVDGADRARAIDTLLTLTSDVAEVVRAQAVEGLIEQQRAGASISAEVFGDLLGDPSGAVRMAAIDGFAESSDDIEVRVAPLLADTLPEVRAVAADALGRIPSLGHPGVLHVALEDSDGAVRLAAARSLLYHSDPSGEAILLDRLVDKHSSPTGLSRFDVVLALGQHRTPQGGESLDRLRSERGDWETRALAAAARCRYSDSQAALEFLKEMLSSRWTRRVEAGLAALHLLPCVELLDEVARLARSRKRRRVASALTVLGSYHQQVESVRGAVRAIYLDLKTRSLPGVAVEIEALGLLLETEAVRSE